MKIPNPKRMRQDAEGNWWYFYKEPSPEQPLGHRAGCNVLTCHVCEDEFVCYPGKPSQTHCSRQCSAKCKDAECNKGRHNTRPYQGAKASRWKGGRMMLRGYVFIFCPEHPSLQGTTRKYIPEHRLVMEKHLGRYLEKHESVHHINGDRADNRLENLQLRQQAHGKGIILRCRCCGSQDIEALPIT